MSNKRPTAITVICVIAVIGAIFSLLLVVSPQVQQIGPWYPPYLGITTIIGLICFYGLWKMKKWAVYAYIGLVVINQIVLAVMGVWNILALLVPVIFIAIMLMHLSRMT